MHTRLRYQIEARLQHAGHPAYPGTWALLAGAALWGWAGVVFGAANAYLGLRAGITIAATYPAAVIATSLAAGAGWIEALAADTGSSSSDRLRRNRPTPAAVPLPVANNSAPAPITPAAIGKTFRGPNRSMAAPATRLNGEYP